MLQQNVLSPYFASKNKISCPLKNILIIQNADWCRITDALQKEDKKLACQTMIQKERDDMITRTKCISAGWDNTIQANEAKIMETKRIRDYQDEEEKVILDEQEVALREKKKYQIMNRAKELLLAQTDRMRKINSALIYSEVLKERELQLEHKQRQEALNRAMLNESYIQADRDNQDIRRRDLEYKRQLRDKKRMVKEDLLDQMTEKAIRKRIEKTQSLSETKGNLQREFDCNTDRGLDSLKKYNQQKVKDGLNQQIDSNRLHKELNKYKEEEDEKRAETFYAGKEKIKKLMKEKHQESINKRMQVQARMFNCLSKMNPDSKDREELIYQTGKEFIERKQDREQQRKIELREHRLREIEQHRCNERAEKIRKNAQKKLKDLNDKRECEEDLIHMLKENERKRIDKLKAKRVNRQELLSQIVDNCAEKEKIRYSGTNDYAKEEDEVNQYAQRLLKARCGKQNVIPLIKAARPGIGGGRGPVFKDRGGIQPKYLSADNQQDLPHFSKIDRCCPTLDLS